MGDDAPAVNLRWMIRGDLPAVLDIESASYEFPWGNDDFVEMLRERPVIGLVATRGAEVVGYVVYRLEKDRIYLHNIAVAHKHRRRGFGTAILSRLKDKLSPQKRNLIEIHVRDSALDAHLFLRTAGFQAVEVCKDWFSDQVRHDPPRLEDAYRFVFRGAPAAEEKNPASPESAAA